MNDSISRQAAIDALVAEARIVDSHYLEFERIIHEDDAVEAISMLPSVPSEPQWVPCSEKMPEYGKVVLVTGIYGAVFIATREYDLIEERYVWRHPEYGKVKIIAWMPLPKPHEERKEADD